MLFSTSTAGLIALIAASIGGGGVLVACFLAFVVVAGTFWRISSLRMKKTVPSYKVSKVIDGAPHDIFQFIMDTHNYPTYVFAC
jgi:hypothetical protein